MKHARPDYDVIQDTATADARDAARYRLLRQRGAAPGGTLHLKNSHLMVATNLDEWLDAAMAGISFAPSHASEGYTASVGRSLPGSPSVSVTTNGTTRLIPHDEPVFLIRGQDVVGADAVRAWADLAEAAGSPPDILAVARAHADKMDTWPKKKPADLPSGRPALAGEAP